MYYTSFLCFFFFFKQKTAYEMRISDWSSDVCSSDLRSLPPTCRPSSPFPATRPPSHATPAPWSTAAIASQRRRPSTSSPGPATWSWLPCSGGEGTWMASAATLGLAGIRRFVMLVAKTHSKKSRLQSKARPAGEAEMLILQNTLDTKGGLRDAFSYWNNTTKKRRG